LDIVGEAAERATESIITNPRAVNSETTPLLANEVGQTRNNIVQGQRKDMRRLDSHSGHHHYNPPPLNGSTCPDVTRQSQILAVAIMEGGLCFHSIFVGLTLAVATGGGFISLFTAIMFHRIILIYTD
jgi:hypothetical protein